MTPYDYLSAALVGNFILALGLTCAVYGTQANRERLRTLGHLLIFAAYIAFTVSLPLIALATGWMKQTNVTDVDGGQMLVCDRIKVIEIKGRAYQINSRTGEIVLDQRVIVGNDLVCRLADE